MNNKKSLVPKLRFPEFTDDWEQRKLVELATFSKGIGFSKSDLKSSGTPIILYGQLYTQYQTVINDVDTFVTSNKNSIFSEGDEVIVPASGETAEDIARASSVGKAGIILGGDLNIIKPYSDINSIFLALNISNGKTQKELSKKAQGKSVVHLRNDDLKTITLIYPRIQEQQKIGSFFTSLDRLITTHQRKLENVKKLKKSLLQKMFPKNGQEFPEIRFPEFTNAWEQKPFSELAFRRSRTAIGNPLPTIEYEDVISSEGQLNKDVFLKDNNKKGIEFKTGDVLFGKLRPYLGNWLHPNFNGIAVGDWWVLGSNILCSDYLYFLIQGKSFQTVANLSAGSKMPRSDWNIVSNTEFYFPLDNQEQQKIGSFFTALDRLISSHQRKLDNMKKLKKALLQQMFV